jgi:toxin FitB
VSYLLDTNVVSELTKPAVNEGVANFLSSAEEESLFLSVVTLAELRYGIERLSAGANRSRLEGWLEEDLLRRFEKRIFLMDSIVATAWGMIRARAERAGRPITEMDAWIAATAAVHGLIVVSRNIGDFGGYEGKVLNPWT